MPKIEATMNAFTLSLRGEIPGQPLHEGKTHLTYLISILLYNSNGCAIRTENPEKKHIVKTKSEILFSATTDVNNLLTNYSQRERKRERELTNLHIIVAKVRHRMRISSAKIYLKQKSKYQIHW